MKKNTSKIDGQEEMLNEKIMTLIKKTDFWIGLTTFIFLAIFAVAAYKTYSKKVEKIITSKNIIATPVVTETAKENTSTVEAKKVMPTTVPVKTTDQKIAKIKKLADTSGFYQVKTGDSFSLISKKVCGSESFFESIQKENGFDNETSLQPGDMISVSCNE
jgi:uncharacterized protein YtpQ (UPF0354 family)